MRISTVTVFGSWLMPILWLTLSCASAEDWPRWRGVRGDGTWKGPAGLAEGTFPSGDLNIAWKVAIGPGYSGVTVANGLVYTMDRVGNDHLERVRCFEAGTGEEKWQLAYEAPYGDLDYGSGPRASVTLHEGKAYAFGAVGHLYCLDAETGEVVWRRDTVKDLGAKYNTWGFSSSPLVYGDTLVMQLGIPYGGCYAALDRATGDLRWRSVDDPAGYATPALFSFDGKDQLACWTPTHIRGLSAAEGRPLWAIPFEVKYGVAIATPIIHGDIVLINEYWAGSKAIQLEAEGDRVKASVLWEKADLCGLMAQPLYRDGFVYLLDKSRGLCCFHLKTGEVVWQDEAHRVTPADRNPQATLVQLRGTNRALMLNAMGELLQLELEPTGYRELARAQLLGKTWAHPAYAGSRVYARDDRSLVCGDLLPGDNP